MKSTQEDLEGKRGTPFLKDDVAESQVGESLWRPEGPQGGPKRPRISPVTVEEEEEEEEGGGAEEEDATPLGAGTTGGFGIINDTI